MARTLGPARRRTGVTGAITLALAGMVGAGVFVGPAAAARTAGAWLFLGIPIAAVVSVLCALGVIAHHTSGKGLGYLGVRWELGVVPGRISAGLYLASRISAMAAIAGAMGQYLLPSSATGVAAVAVLLVVLVSNAGLRIRGTAHRAFAWLAFLILAVVVITCFAIPPAPMVVVSRAPHGVLDIMGAAGTMFFGYLGFERVAASASERDDHRVVLRDVIVAIVIVTVVAVVTSAALLYQLGSARMALSPTPIADALGAAGAPNLVALVSIGVGVAMAPALLFALESFRATGRAVVADGDLPRLLGRTGRGGTPYLLDLSAGVVAAALAQVLAPAQAIELAVCCVLVHYAFVNISAQRTPNGGKWWARAVCVGMILAVALAMSMPVAVLLTTLLVAVASPVLAGAISGRWR